MRFLRMGRTKKVGIIGKYGARYGTTIRSRVIAVEKTRKKSHSCPNCLKKTLKRASAGIWECKKCDSKFAGGSHIPTTAEGVI